MSIDIYGRLPVLPERTLRQHDAFEPSDSRFRAAARLQQSLWREQHGWKAGYQIGPDGNRTVRASREVHPVSASPPD